MQYTLYNNQRLVNIVITDYIDRKPTEAREEINDYNYLVCSELCVGLLMNQDSTINCVRTDASKLKVLLITLLLPAFTVRDYA